MLYVNKDTTKHDLQLSEDVTMEKAELLLVEDNEELRTFLAGELKDLFHVSLAKDGKEGLEKTVQQYHK